MIRVENLSKCYRLGTRESPPTTGGKALAGILGAPWQSLRSVFGEPSRQEPFYAL